MSSALTFLSPVPLLSHFLLLFQAQCLPTQGVEVMDVLQCCQIEAGEGWGDEKGFMQGVISDELDLQGSCFTL